MIYRICATLKLYGCLVGTKMAGLLSLRLSTYRFKSYVVTYIKITFYELTTNFHKELFKKEITIASYYSIFFCVGAFGNLILFINGTYNV